MCKYKSLERGPRPFILGKTRVNNYDHVGELKSLIYCDNKFRGTLHNLKKNSKWTVPCKAFSYRR